MIELAGYYPAALRIGYGSLDQAASHHVEVTAPQGLELVGASLLALRMNAKPLQLSKDTENPDIAHLRFMAAEGDQAIEKGARDLQIQIRAWTARGPLTIQAALLASFNVLVLAAGLLMRLLLPAYGWNLHHGTAGAAILVGAPAALSVVTAAQDRGITYRVQRVLRTQLFVAVGVSFAMAASMAVDGFRGDQLIQIWRILFGVAAADFLWVGTSWLWRRLRPRR